MKPIPTIRLLAHYECIDTGVYVDNLLDDIFCEELIPLIMDSLINSIVKEESPGQGKSGKCKSFFLVMKLILIRIQIAQILTPYVYHM